MELSAKKREITGKNNRTIREHGLVPAVLYGPDFTSLSMSINLKDFVHLYKKAGESTIVDLRVEGEKGSFKVLIKDTQVDPVSGAFIHVDFYKANLAEKVSVAIPIKTSGESPIVKSGGGIILTLLNEITVEALPLDLPHELVVDISNLSEIGQVISVKDLPMDHNKVKVLQHHGEDVVLKVDYAIQIEKEEEVKSVEEIEVLKEKKEGEEGTEGETKEGTGSAAKETSKTEKEDAHTPAGKKEKK